MPLTLRAIRSRLTRVSDLTNGAIRVAIRVAEDRMVSAEWEGENAAGREALTQAVGRAAFGAGYEGMLVPSTAARQSYNVVVFVESLEEESMLALADG